LSGDLPFPTIAVIDCQLAGISGDMFVGALIDAGANEGSVLDAMSSAPRYLEGCRGLEVTAQRVRDHGFKAVHVRVMADDPIEHRRAPEVRRSLQEWLDGVELSEQGKSFALRTLDTLIRAEATVHGVSEDRVILHESGNADTLADIAGTAVGLDDLKLIGAPVYCTPVAVGGGLFRFSHGTVSSPAPGALEILRGRGVPLVGGPVEAELTTPTGAAILANLITDSRKFYPLLRALKVGYGAGGRKFEGFADILRLVIGESDDRISEKAFIVETNVDDVSGEVLGHLVDRLLAEGAFDVHIFAAVGKKNRPSHMVKAVVGSTRLDEVSRALLRETGSLGVRIYPCERRLLAREGTEVEMRIGGVTQKVRVKVARDERGRPLRIKPEYEDAVRIAKECELPLRDVLEIISTEVRRRFLSG